MILLFEHKDGAHQVLHTVDDSLPLPQRIGHAVDVVVDVVGCSGQLIHLRLELPNGLKMTKMYAVINEQINRRSVKPISTISSVVAIAQQYVNELKEIKISNVFTILTFFSCFSSVVFSSQPLGHKTP